MELPKMRVLVVEDVRDQYLFVRDLLSAARSIRFETDWAVDVPAALKKLQANTYDVCLVDYHLGDRNGIEIIETSQFHDAPMIMLTGSGGYDVDVAALQAGAADYLPKARLNITALERSIRYAVEHAQTLRAMETLLETSNILNSTLDFDDVLEHILRSIGQVIPHDAAGVMLIDDSVTHVIGQHSDESRRLTQAIRAQQFRIEDSAGFRQMKETHQPLVVADLQTSQWAHENPELAAGFKTLHAYAGAPIIVNDQVIGFLNVASVKPGYFDPRQAQRLQAFASQAAIAIQNAQRYKQARELAIIQERQRIARDLHDSVSQTIFSAGMIAETLPRLWERDSDETPELLGELHQLTRKALAEMRLLLFELRPEAMAEVSLNHLIEQQTQIFRGQSKMQVRLSMEGGTDILPDVKMAMYRIFQESLNNILKHSQAQQVTIDLHEDQGQVLLSVIDDGRGFDMNAVPPERFGLRIMQERAQDAGIAIEIDSAVGEGTEIVLMWRKGN